MTLYVEEAELNDSGRIGELEGGVLEFVAGYASKQLNRDHWFTQKCARWAISLQESGLRARAIVPAIATPQELLAWISRQRPAVLLSRAFAVDSRFLAQVANALPGSSVVQVNHTPNSFMPTDKHHGLLASLEAISYASSYPNYHYGLVSKRDAAMIQRLHKDAKVCWLPNPTTQLARRTERVALPGDEPISLVLAARAATQKNIKNQIDAFGLVAQQRKIVAHLFLEWEDRHGLIDETMAYASTVLKSCGSEVVRHKFTHPVIFAEFLASKAHIVSHCSFDEAASYLALEAMLLGVPTVCSSAIDWAPFQVSPTETAEIALAIERAIANYVEWSDRCRTAAEIVSGTVDRQFQEGIRKLIR